MITNFFQPQKRQGSSPPNANDHNAKKVKGDARGGAEAPAQGTEGTEAMDLTEDAAAAGAGEAAAADASGEAAGKKKEKVPVKEDTVNKWLSIFSWLFILNLGKRQDGEHPRGVCNLCKAAVKDRVIKPVKGWTDPSGATLFDGNACLTHAMSNGHQRAVDHASNRQDQQRSWNSMASKAVMMAALTCRLSQKRVMMQQQLRVQQQVEGVLRIQWALEGDTDVAAADPADESDCNWDTVHEAKQKHDYMEQLEKLVQVPPFMQWSEQVDKNDLLKTYPGIGGAIDLPFTIGCRTDALIILRFPSFPPDAKIVATVELKKRVVQQSMRQAKATFLCATLHSMMPVVSILTDMKQGHAAFYCRGPEPGTGRRVCVQHVFKTLSDLCQFLQTALHSVPRDALKFHGDTMVSVPQLQDPVRKLLLPPTEPSLGS